MQRATPQFLFRREPRYRCWREEISILVRRGGSGVPVGLIRLRAPFIQRQTSKFSRALFSSVLLHFAVPFFLLRLPLFLFYAVPEPREHNRKIIYDVQKIDLSAYLPNLRQPGPGGRPGQGTRPDQQPARGSTAFNSRKTVVSKPPLPDNSRQTIVQLPSPPDLRIPFELRLPDMLVLRTLTVPPAPPNVNLASIPVHIQPRKISPTVPVVPAAPPPADPPTAPSDIELPVRPLPNLLAHLKVPAPPPPVPTPSAIPPEIALALSPIPKLLLRLAVPPPPAPAEAANSTNAAAAAGLGNRDENPIESPGLFAVNIQPGQWTGLLALPPGNRYGDFSISPAGGQLGSPGGVPAGDPKGGTGGAGTGGDGSTAVGSGSGGGGGAGANGKATFSISGDRGSRGVGGWGALFLDPPLTRVYPVLSQPRTPRNTLLITTGPLGGGGLQVYGVLRGGKIHTTYLSMPGKQWILQYCQYKDYPSRNGAPRQGDMVADLQQNLTAPWPKERFDFQRSPTSGNHESKTIILHGVIREDGSVEELRVLQGVQPEADQTALAAFGRWKFQPALRSGEPIPVEILVGIPVTVSSMAEPREGERVTPFPSAERIAFPLP